MMMMTADKLRFMIASPRPNWGPATVYEPYEKYEKWVPAVQSPDLKLFSTIKTPQTAGLWQ